MVKSKQLLSGPKPLRLVTTPRASTEELLTPITVTKNG